MEGRLWKKNELQIWTLAITVLVWFFELVTIY